MASSMLQLLPLLLLLSLLRSATADFASDQAQCANQLVGLATCLTYVEGEAKAPSPDCCTGFKQVVGQSMKCLCVLIKDRNEPSLGFKVNVTRALTLPSLCSVPTNVVECIKLLNAPPNSQLAKDFQQFGSALEGNNTTPSTGSGPAKGSPADGGKHANNARKMSWLGVEIRVGIWMWTFALLALILISG